MKRYKRKIPYSVGAMIEVPRAAVTADEIAREADFFSFGTNDLTQTTFGFSRDDSGKFIQKYMSRSEHCPQCGEKLDRDLAAGPAARPTAGGPRTSSRPTCFSTIDRAGGAAPPDGRGEGEIRPPLPESRRLRGARRGPEVGGVLRRGGARLRFLLPLQRARRPAGRRPGGAPEAPRGQGKEKVGQPGNDSRCGGPGDGVAFPLYIPPKTPYIASDVTHVHRMLRSGHAIPPGTTETDEAQKAGTDRVQILLRQDNV